MSDHDLTSITETVTAKHWNRELAGSDLSDEAKAQRTWDLLPATAKRNLKETVLPIIIDVLTAVEPEPQGTTMVEYDFLNSDRNDPRWYENQHPQQHDTTTATVWVAHLNVCPDDKDHVLARVAATVLEVTGEYTYGDSFKEWGEPVKDDGDGHLCIYFRAAPREAWRVGSFIGDVATFAIVTSGARRDVECYVSTSGDYAEQVRS